MLEVHRFPYTAILGWSASRYDTYRRCKRQYYYQYYAKHDPELPRERVEKLKKLTSMPLEVGSIVHDTVAAILNRLLKSGAAIDRKRFDEFVEKRTALVCRGRTFSEVYYVEQEAVEPEDILPKIQACLETFLGSERYAWVVSKARENRDEWIVEPPGYGESRLDGMKVYCKVDFLFVVDDRVVILDWKTGKRDDEKYAKQMLGYGAWAMHHLNRPAADIDTYVAYLRPEYEELHVRPTEAQLTGFVERIRSETDEMYALCRDVPENLPVEKEAFPMTENENLCRFCNYRELCDRVGT